MRKESKGNRIRRQPQGVDVCWGQLVSLSEACYRPTWIDDKIFTIPWGTTENEEGRGKFSLKLSVFVLRDSPSVHYNVLHSFLENEYWNARSFTKWQSLEDYHCFLKCLFVAKLETGNLLSTSDFLKIYFIFGCARSLKEHGFFPSSCGRRGLLCSCGAQVSSSCAGFSCCGAQALGAWFP